MATNNDSCDIDNRLKNPNGFELFSQIPPPHLQAKAGFEIAQRLGEVRASTFSIAGVTGIGDEAAQLLMKAFEDNKTITSLDVSNCGLGTASINALCQMMAKNHTITVLNAENNQIKSDELQALARLISSSKTLTSLDISNSPLSTADAAESFADALKTNKTLIQLSISQPGPIKMPADMTEQICLALKNSFSPIQELGLGGLYFNAGSMSALCSWIANSPCIRRLDLSQACFRTISKKGVTSQSPLPDNLIEKLIMALRQNKTLRVLNLEQALEKSATKMIWQYLQTNDHLFEVNVSTDEIGDECIEDVSQIIRSNKVLQQITFSQRTSLTDKAIKKWTKMIQESKSKLLIVVENGKTSPDLCSGLLDNAEFNGAEYHGPLYARVWGDWYLGKGVSSEETGSYTLQGNAIYCRPCSPFYICYYGIQLLVRDMWSKNISTLCLPNLTLGDESCNLIAQQLMLCKTITKLDLGTSCQTSQQLQTMCSAIKRAGSQYLSLHMNNFRLTAEGMKCVADLLMENESLTSLTSNDNVVLIADTLAATAFAQALKAHRTFKHLTFTLNPWGMNEILKIRGSPGVLIILNELVDYPLTTLNISGWKLKEEEAKKIEQMMKNNKTLQKLYLDSCDIGSSKGAAAIAEGLRNNQTLLVLSLNNNSLLSDGVGQVMTALCSNTTLKSLSVECNKMESPAIPDFVCNVIKSNTTLEKLFLSEPFFGLNRSPYIIETQEKNHIKKAISQAEGSSKLKFVRIGNGNPSTPREEIAGWNKEPAEKETY